MFSVEAEAAAHLATHALTPKQLLKAMVRPASRLARPPISAFSVSAVGISASGRVFVGVNVEFASLPLANSIHAEQFLLANLRKHEERELVMDVAVNAAPYGHCRQFYSELACADAVQIVFGPGDSDSDSAGDSDHFSLDQLLPHRFRPQDLLGERPPPLLLQPQRCPVALSGEARGLLQARAGDAPFQAAAAAALRKAQEVRGSRVWSGLGINGRGGMFGGMFGGWVRGRSGGARAGAAHTFRAGAH